MGYHLTTSLDLPPARSHASPKTHTPLPRLQERGYRFYSTELSRWISRDPIEEEDGPNIGAFCRNDAINLFDPNGESAASYLLCVMACGLGFGSVSEMTDLMYLFRDYDKAPRDLRRAYELEARKILTGSRQKPTDEAIQKTVKELAEKRFRHLLEKRIGAKAAKNLLPWLIPEPSTKIIAVGMNLWEAGQWCKCGYQCATGTFH